jgi:hypothetical protein
MEASKMCVTDDEIGTADRRCSIIEWFRRRALGLTASDSEGLRNLHRGLRIAQGEICCKRCAVILESEDKDSLHEGWCYNCDAQWFEEAVVAPLVHRLGRRGAIRAFRRLVANVKALV